MENIAKKAQGDISQAWEKIDSLIEGFFNLLPNLVISLVVLVGFWFLAVFVKRMVDKWGDSRNSTNLGVVLGRIGKWAVLLVGVMVAVSIVSPSVSPADLLGVLGIGSVAIGFAFKDILQNFLAGILILLREPFQVGDSIVFADYTGTVESIETRSTILRTFDGQRVIIPNGSIFTSSIEVISAYPNRRKDAVIGIGYEDDIGRAMEKAIEAMNSVEGVLDSPKPQVTVEELAASSVNLKALWWSRNEDYMKVYTKVFIAIKEAFDMDNIEMPYSKVELVNKQVEVKLSGDK